MSCYGYNYSKRCYPSPTEERIYIQGPMGPQDPQGETGCPKAFRENRETPNLLLKLLLQKIL